MPIYYPILTHIDIEETRRYAGIAKTPNFKTSMLQKVCTEAQILVSPAASWSIYPYDALTGEILANVPLQLSAKSITKHLANATQVAVLAVTIGETIEQAITDSFAQGRYTEALLLDAAATTAVEAAADQVNALINQQALQVGLASVFRFSPGYGNWDLVIQPEILKLAQGSSIGITTTPSCMLMPRKSVTAVIGLVPNHSQTNLQHSNNSCTNCCQTTCHARKESKNDPNI
ncbi:hypothetical protein SDC9_04241 [bioreactor metagenome]|uniref:AdoMet activation domain-containing protein n=1 Tax=bioreactor metagenome TaxID=1076179 RepID=A0A644SVH6_9ZZZZ|nr:vitamin B12 dependent-methionine synthase activation domain-containing protein [Negativicutes bacterium]